MIRSIVSSLFLVLCLGVGAQEMSDELNAIKSTFLDEKYDEVIEMSSKVLSAEGKDSVDMAMAYSYAGLSYENLNKPAKAIENYKGAISYNVPRLDIYDQLINLTKSVDDSENYEWALHAKMKAFPDFKTEISQSLASHYSRTKQYEALLKEAAALNEIYPEDTKYLYYQGMAYQKLKDEDKAYEVFSKILEIEPEHIGANMGAGIYLYKKGSIMFKKEKAKYESKKSPSRVDYTNYLNSLDKAKGVYSEALKYLLVAYNDGGKTSLKPAISNIYTRLGEKEKAEQFK
ncbi:tetratricopeptide repeat protein [Carboxylicivirga linearis]|uniref:Tetratricopeptide repeat protein n=1 Tax=Carboxylicivirga linearis TaxID=1628157 RepID=A0ABS5JXU3_9BACT|nr:tetratricopeptide repeat protein [Carboxylicivirga linearis]MBS2099620.1 tetratricopeptide repeat protein [Carboxylicivirga linearis]